MRFVYHHIAEPAPWLASVKSSLKPGGRFLVIDFPPTWWLAWSVPKGAPPNRKGHGITADEVEKELRAAGFVIEKRIEPWDGRRFAILARRE
jgi:SAM-dependent methyltransferase